MPASIRLRAVGAVIAGCLLTGTAPGAPAQAAETPAQPRAAIQPAAAPVRPTAPLITLAMATSGDPAPRYDIRVRNGTDGMVKTTVRQELPAGATPAMISQGGLASVPGTTPGQLGTEVVWQVQLGARSSALLHTTLVPPARGIDVTAPACAFVAGGNMPYDCATATWNRARAAAGPDDPAQAQAAASPPWWRRGGLPATAIAALVLLVAAGGALWWRRLRRRRAAGQVNATPVDRVDRRAAKREAKREAKRLAAERRAAEQQAAGAARRVRRSGSPIARARARVRRDHKIPVPESVRRVTGHPRIGGAAEQSAPAPGTGAPLGATRAGAHLEQRRPADDAVLDDGRLLRDGGLARADETAGADGTARADGTAGAAETAGVDGTAEAAGTIGPEGHEPGTLVGIAGGARYVGRAPVPPRAPVPDGDEEPAEEAVPEPPEPTAEDLAPVVGRARPAPHPAATYRPPRRRPRPPAWAAVGFAALLAVALAGLTAWTGSSQVSAINGDRQPSSGAWIGQTVAGPLGTGLRESAFEFTVYRLVCPPAPGGCQAILGVRNLTDRSQQWHGTLQRAYLPSGDWVGADVPATQVANAGKDPFAEPVAAGQRMITPLVFASTGAAEPTRIELRSAVFSAGVSVDVPH
ncbi:hypothetical protein O7626_06090 [Micromonospora sp. WMMD1102]|uniref:hypothetical protein n=1 Tax=Micromonospora sp. WMMD1102 TaxID=3016105 RepID=UPI00241520D4|nr:hypothetical protein [Micromonospora sp. WMMD1102]MDG4785508.1 hypothetical protein [Micromonospora sp. WMMD1102]